MCNIETNKKYNFLIMTCFTLKMPKACYTMHIKNLRNSNVKTTKHYLDKN